MEEQTAFGTMRVVASSVSAAEAAEEPESHLDQIPVGRRYVSADADARPWDDTAAWRDLARRSYRDVMEGWDPRSNGRLHGAGPYRWAVRLLGVVPPSSTDTQTSASQKVSMRCDLLWDLLRAMLVQARRDDPALSLGRVKNYLGVASVTELPTEALWPDADEKDFMEDMRKALFGGAS